MKQNRRASFSSLVFAYVCMSIYTGTTLGGGGASWVMWLSDVVICVYIYIHTYTLYFYHVIYDNCKTSYIHIRTFYYITTISSDKKICCN